jgi:iron complex transport system ATP-binding protein
MVKISVKNIDFAYHKKNVLDGISIEFEKGGIHAVLGPNGSGKSTLIRCLLGFLKVKNGQIFIDEKKQEDYSLNQLARKVAYVAQSEQAVFSNSVYDTILLGRKPYIGFKPKQKDFDKVEEIILKLSLEEIKHKDLDKISGGQRQRALIGRALAQEPEVLLLDEPTANLDLKHQFATMNILKELSENGMTVILAIHDLNLALKYCNHFVMLDEGKLFLAGDKNIFSKENIEHLYKIKIGIYQEHNDVFVLPKEAI